jgi:hypothetical protein
MEDCLEKYLTEIEKELPPVVFRNWPRWRDVLPFAPKSLANDDVLGIGPKEKIFMGRNAGYPRASFMAYLRTKLRTSRKKEDA